MSDKENSSCRTSSFKMDDGQHIYTNRSSRKYQGRYTEKIDGVIATIMALDRAIRCGNDTSESVYDDRGLIVL